MNFVERVEYNLRGCEAVSTGVCPGCEECYDALGDKPHEDEDGVWCFDGQRYESEEDAIAAARDGFQAAWANGSVIDEPSFSWSECDICGSRLGGDRSVWHYIADGELRHGDGACVDCVLYLANGDIPKESE